MMPRAPAGGIGALPTNPIRSPVPPANVTPAPRPYGAVQRPDGQMVGLARPKVPEVTRPGATAGRPVGSAAAAPTAPASRAPAPQRAAKPGKPKKEKGAPVAKGDSVGRALKALRMESPAQALLCVPQEYADLRQVHRALPSALDRADMEQARLYSLHVSGLRHLDANRNPIEPTDSGYIHWPNVRSLEIELIDQEQELVTFTVFGNVWPYKNLGIGEHMYLVARVERRGRRRFLFNVEHPPVHAIGRVWARYSGIQGRIAAETIDTMVRGQMGNPDAFRVCATLITAEVGERAEVALGLAGAAGRFTSFEALLRALHEPETPEMGLAALGVASKLTTMGLQAAVMRKNKRPAHPRAPLPVSSDDVRGLMDTQRERDTVTEEQLRVMKGVVDRLKDPWPLNALLQGDVGTGKTLAYLVPAVLANRAGARVAIIAPTGLLADQIAEQLFTRFEGQVSGIQRVPQGGKILDHAAILVSTWGLGTVARKAGYEPNLLIIDEQHKMSTDAKEAMVKPWTHVLEATATPVPRSLASVEFGGKDIFNLRGCHVKKTFRNHIADVADRATFAKMIREILKEGGRAAVVYPRVEASEEAKLAARAAEAGQDAPVIVDSLLEAARSLETAFPGKVVAVHAGMKEAEIAQAIAQVKSGERPLLVASTVIETGVDIPSMRMMIVREADRFGIAQLAQLRGRLVRDGGVGDFVMMVKDMSQLDAKTFERLEAVRTENDGYKLAERDLEIRGFGQLDGQDQSGGVEGVFRLLKLTSREHIEDRLRDDGHVETLQAATAVEVAEDPEEEQIRARALRQSQGRLFG
jgi:ATP-dependent DNA helicase RecG